MSIFPQPRALKRRSPLLSLMLAAGLCACATPTVTVLTVQPCSKLVPPELSAPTPGADLPADDSQGAWVRFGDAQTGQLDKANLTKAASLSIVKACEGRDQDAAKALRPRPWWVLWRR